jgi:hypothetical protein
MNRRAALAVAIVGLNLMACCCGGPIPQGQNQAKPQGRGAPNPEKQQPEPKRTKFNQALIEKYNLKQREFPSLQYYLAGDLVLSRELSKEDSAKPQKGKLVQSKGQVIEEIGITSQTPGVCTAAETDDKGTNWLTMSFEQGTTIFFRQRPSEDCYTVMDTIDGSDSRVKFMGNSYTASRPSVNAAYVVVAEESLENFQKNRKDLKGVVIPK